VRQIEEQQIVDERKSTPACEEVASLIERAVGEKVNKDQLRIITDTSNFFQVNYGDVVSVGDDLLLVRGVEREGRFGLDDQPKDWVKMAIDLRSGDRKVLKLAFFETYHGNFGSVEYKFFRSPGKEARILDVVRGHPHFMQGYGITDTKGNVLRVLEYVKGVTVHEMIAEIKDDHETYFYKRLPDILASLVKAYEAIEYLHGAKEIHGDIRRDHLIVERDTANYVWIDFDYAYENSATRVGFDLLGLGNILSYVVGKGDVIMGELKKDNSELFSKLSENDLNIVFRTRLANLKKLYPYIPEKLNRVLLHFSRGANVFYESVTELLNDLKPCVVELLSLRRDAHGPRIR